MRTVEVKQLWLLACAYAALQVNQLYVGTLVWADVGLAARSHLNYVLLEVKHSDHVRVGMETVCRKFRSNLGGVLSAFSNSHSLSFTSKDKVIVDPIEGHLYTCPNQNISGPPSECC